MTSEIEQMSPKFFRYPQSDFTFCLPTLGRHPTFRTLTVINKRTTPVILTSGEDPFSRISLYWRSL